MISLTGKENFAKRGQRFIRWARRVLLISGALALSYVAFVAINAKLFQNNAELTLEKQIDANEQHPTEPIKIAVKEGDILGRIAIPRIGMSVVVLQGTKSKTLRLGVGHIEGTALPGEPGNIGIAGHRDTFFRGLKDIREDDEIRLQTTTGIDRYDVDWIRITAPGDSGVLAPTTESAITLVTCYPFYYIGAAPKRFVVHAHKL